jgi:uncharacterized membrane protein YkoI
MKVRMSMKDRMRKIILLLICAVLCGMLTGCGDNSLKDLIGKPKASEIALANAGFPARWVIELKTDYGHEDGKRVYEVSFINSTTKYEYVIDGETGGILQNRTEPLFGDGE